MNNAKNIEIAEYFGIKESGVNDALKKVETSTNNFRKKLKY